MNIADNRNQNIVNEKIDMLTTDQQHILYKTHYKSVFKTIYYLLKDKETSKDLTQETFIKTFEKYDVLEEKHKFKSLLCNIGLNLARNHIKKYSKINLIEDNKLLDLEIDSIESEFIEKAQKIEVRDKVRKAISELDEKYKEVILLKYYKELSCNEIANKLNLNVNTVYTRINRAKEKISSLL